MFPKRKISYPKVGYDRFAPRRQPGPKTRLSVMGDALKNGVVPPALQNRFGQGPALVQPVAPPPVPAAPAPTSDITHLGEWFPGGNPDNGTGGVVVDEPHAPSGGRIVFRADNGNIMVRMPWGETVSWDQWGNRIPHLGFFPEQMAGPAAPPAPPPGSLPPPTGPATFYAPTAASPYLNFDDRFLGLLGVGNRDALRREVTNLGFTPTGSLGQYGETSYVAAPNFNQNDLNNILDPTLRQWLKFWLGNLGYGQSYTVPGTFAGGGYPPAPGM